MSLFLAPTSTYITSIIAYDVAYLMLQIPILLNILHLIIETSYTQDNWTFL